MVWNENKSKNTTEETMAVGRWEDVLHPLRNDMRR